MLRPRGMRTPVSNHHQTDHAEADRPTAAASARDAFSQAENRYGAQEDNKRTGGRVDGLLRAHAALVHEIE